MRVRRQRVEREIGELITLYSSSPRLRNRKSRFPRFRLTFYLYLEADIQCLDHAIEEKFSFLVAAIRLRIEADNSGQGERGKAFLLTQYYQTAFVD
jgi:hypothetical protein